MLRIIGLSIDFLLKEGIFFFFVRKKKKSEDPISNIFFYKSAVSVESREVGVKFRNEKWKRAKMLKKKIFVIEKRLLKNLFKAMIFSAIALYDSKILRKKLKNVTSFRFVRKMVGPVSSDREAVLMYEWRNDWLESYLDYEAMEAICMIFERSPFLARKISPFWKIFQQPPFFRKASPSPRLRDPLLPCSTS